METLKVSAKSEPKLVAGAIAATLRNDGKVEIIAVGAAAVNQAVKSICVTKGYVINDEIDVVFTPSFLLLDIEGAERTGICLKVEKRS